MSDITPITPSKLRAASTTGADWLPIPASCGEMQFTVAPADQAC